MDKKKYALLSDTKEESHSHDTQTNGEYRAQRSIAAARATAAEMDKRKSSKWYIPKAEYYNVPGIPIPELYHLSMYSICRFASAFAIIILASTGWHIGANDRGIVELPSELQRLEVALEGCDFITKFDLPSGQRPYISYQSWKFMGYVNVTQNNTVAANSSLRIVLFNYKRSKHFRCDARLHLPRGITKVAEEFHLGAAGANSVLVSTQPQSAFDRLAVGRFLNFSVLDAQCHVSDVDAPEALFNIRSGFLEIGNLRSSNLQVKSKYAAVDLHSDRVSLSLMLTIHGKTVDRSMLSAANVKVHSNSSDSVTWYLNGEHTTLFQVAASIETEASPVNVYWGKLDSRKPQVFLGDEQKTPNFLQMRQDVFKHVKDFIKSASGDPYIVNLRVLGPGVPAGTWQIMSSKAYLAMSLEWFILLSGGLLYPLIFRADVHLIGMESPVHNIDVYEMLLTHLQGVQGTHTNTMLWVPVSSSGEWKIFELEHGHNAIERSIRLSDIWLFKSALCLNILGGAMIAGYVAYLFFTAVVPFVKTHAYEETLEESSTHRLRQTPSPAMAWHIFGCRVIYPRLGVLIRWSSRENFAKFVQYQIRCESKTGHSFSFNVMKQHVDISKDNPVQRQYVVSDCPVKGNHREPLHDVLQNMQYYKFQIAALGKDRVECEASLWSYFIHVRPWITFTDIPFILCRIAFGVSEEHFPSLQMFCEANVKQIRVKTHVMLSDVQVEFNSSLLDHYKTETKPDRGEQVLYMCLVWESADHKFGTKYKLHEARPIKLDDFVKVDSSWLKLKTPLQFTIARESAEETELALRIAERCGDDVREHGYITLGDDLERSCFRFAELHEQWERQYEYLDDEEGCQLTLEVTPSMRVTDGSNAARSSRSVSRSSRRSRDGAMEHCRPKKGYEHKRMLRAQGDWRVKFWVGFGETCNDIGSRWSWMCNDAQDKMRWLHYPVTPYSQPLHSCAGVALPADVPWKRCGIRGIWPNEVILQGTKKTLFWSSRDLKIGGSTPNRDDLLLLELCPIKPCENFENLQLKTIAEGVQVGAGQFVWNVPLSDDGQYNTEDRFVVVASLYTSTTRPEAAHRKKSVLQGLSFGASGSDAEKPAEERSLPSVAFFVDRPLLLSEFEMGYAAFCRSYGQPMEAVSSERVGQLGYRVTNLPVNVCEGVRQVLPAERASRGCDQIRFCQYHGAVVPSMKPIQLEDSTEIFRIALQMTKVLEGASWKNRVETWYFEPLIEYHVDYSWWLQSALKHHFPDISSGILCQIRCIFKGLMEIVLYFMQIFVFLLPPVLCFVLLLLQESMHEDIYVHSFLQQSTIYITDWLAEPTDPKRFFQLSLKRQLGIILICVYTLIVSMDLFYMNFLRVPFPSFFWFFESISVRMLSTVSFLTLMYMVDCLMGVMLGALISPSAYGPIAVMVSGIFLVGGSMFRQHIDLRESVLDQLDKMMDVIIEALLDEFLGGRVERIQMGDSLKVEHISDTGKAAFVRAVCDLGVEVTTTEHESKESTEEESSAIADDEEQYDTERIGSFSISATVRRKLETSFKVTLEKLPLPPVVEESLSDARQLAKTCMEVRTEAMDKLVGEHGKQTLKDIVKSNLDTRIQRALVSVLDPKEQEGIDITNSEELAMKAALFLDNQLADQILSTVQCKLDEYKEALRTKMRHIFEQSRTDDAFSDRLEQYEELFDKYIKDHNLSIPSRKGRIAVDCSGDGQPDAAILPFLQAIEVLPPMQTLETALRGEEAERLPKMVEILFRTLEEHCKKTIGSSDRVLRHRAVVIFINSLVNNQAGRVENLWWSAFKEVCEDIYVYRKPESGKDDFTYPCVEQDLAEAWIQETWASGGRHVRGKFLLPVNRIEDVVLGSLMTRNGRKKIWKEAFVLMARFLQLWPEIPMDDTVVEVRTQPSTSVCEVLSHVPAVRLPERDKYNRETRKCKPIEDKEAKVRGIGKWGPSFGFGMPVFSEGDDDELVFESMGDFGPQQGFAMLHFSKKDLQRSDREDWLELDWDCDAEEIRDGVDVTWKDPPFPGPLWVYLVFVNLHPHKPHAKRKWIERDDWEVVEGKRLPTVGQRDDVVPMRSSSMFGSVAGGAYGTYIQGSTYGGHRGFGEPSWKDSDKDKGLEPYHEVRRKEFAPRKELKLKGLNTKDPVLIFFEVQRTTMPDRNSFQDAHRSFFMKSDFFAGLWKFHEKREYLRRNPHDRRSYRQSNSGEIADEDFFSTGMIDSIPDGPELMRKMILREYVVGRDSSMKEERKNAGLNVLMAEELRHGLSADQCHNTKHDVKITPVWLDEVDHDFYIEDMDFRLLELEGEFTEEFSTFLFQTLAVRNSECKSSTWVGIEKIAFLKDNCVIWETSMSHANDDPDIKAKQQWLHGDLLGVKLEDPPKFPVLVVDFTKPLRIDEVDIITSGSENDPALWKIYGIVDPKDSRTSPVEPKPLAERLKEDGPYPLSHTWIPGHTHRGEIHGGKVPLSELISIGKPQNGAIWFSDGESWMQMRGLWFDAFEELLKALSMKMDTPAAWSLWRHVLSFKYQPITVQDPAGFIDTIDVKEALKILLEEDPFISDQTFLEFCAESQFDLDDQFSTRLYNSICDKSPDFKGAHNLVRWKDFAAELKQHINGSKPYIERSEGKKKKKYTVGSLWFEPLFQVVIKSIPDIPSRETVRELYKAHADPYTGLLPMDQVYDVIVKLGRPGVKLAEFINFIKRLGMQVDDRLLTLTFNQIDINQNDILDELEVQCGMQLLMRNVLPDQVARAADLSIDLIVKQVFYSVSVLAVIFLFLLLSFMSLLSSGAGGLQSIIQSATAGGAAIMVQVGKSRALTPEQLVEFVTHHLESCVGPAAKIAARMMQQPRGLMGMGMMPMMAGQGQPGVPGSTTS